MSVETDMANFRKRLVNQGFKASGVDNAIAGITKMCKLEDIQRRIRACKACNLCKSPDRTRTVPGMGFATSSIYLLGEGPGEHEDRFGLPFVGVAGVLLTSMLASIGIRREDLYVSNVVKCRPEGNRQPLPAECNACVTWVAEEIIAIKPKLIIAAGNVALKALVPKAMGITKARGLRHDITIGGATYPVIPLVHPANTVRLRDEELKEEKLRIQQDLRKVATFIGNNGQAA